MRRLRDYWRAIRRRGRPQLRRDDELDGCDLVHRIRDRREWWTRDERIEEYLIPLVFDRERGDEGDHAV